MVHYVAASKQIREVILSGGDPLTYDDEKLEYDPGLVCGHTACGDVAHRQPDAGGHAHAYHKRPLPDTQTLPAAVV